GGTARARGARGPPRVPRGREHPHPGAARARRVPGLAELPAVSFLAALYLVVALLLLGTLAAQSVAARHRQVISVTFGSALRLLVGLGLFAAVLYATAYFLGLGGGFYESLTCKVVTLPSCEDPLALPAWLALPEASVGGVIGILPLLGIFLAKALQPKRGRAGPNPDEPAYDAATYEA